MLYLEQSWELSAADSNAVVNAILCGIYDDKKLLLEGFLYLWSSFSQVTPHSVHPPPLSAEGVEPPTKFSERGGLAGPQLLEGVTSFRGSGNFYVKDKLKSEILIAKKLYKQKYFSQT